MVAAVTVSGFDLSNFILVSGSAASSEYLVTTKRTSVLIASVQVPDSELWFPRVM